jgi:uncharacterized protein YaiL (DUF2058 family)
MSKSLQEQLMSLGLAQEKPGKNSQQRSSSGKTRPSHKKSGKKVARNSHQTKSRQTDEEIALSRAYALRHQEEKRQIEETKRKKQQEDRRRRELNTKLKAIVKENRLNDANADVPRNFMYKGRIRKINLTAEQLKAVNQGELGVVYLLGGYHLLTAEHVAAVRKLSEEHVPDLAGAAEDDEEFPVPDDLIW